MQVYGFNFIKNHNRKAWKKLPRTRVEYNDYNERAITEALVNALIHRMYDIIGAEIHIDIFDNRLEIFSPGGMYDGSEIQNRDILNIPSVRRNPVIADVFQRLDFMERRGSGFKKIYEAIQNKNLIKVESNRTDFKVTFINENYNRQKENIADKNYTENYTENLNKTQVKIIKLINKNPNITQNQLAEKLKLTRAAIAFNLKKMKEKEIIERVGSERNGIWKIVNK